jgi:hypothetical protein
MSKRSENQRTVSPAARVFSSLQAEEALLPGRASALRRSGAVVLALLVLGAFPLYLAANAAGLIGDTPAALAKGSNSGPGDGDEDDGDNSGPGGGDDDDTGTQTRTGHNRAEGTDDTSRDGHSTRGTTNDNDTRTHLGTNDTSRNGDSTRGTTNDNDTNTNTRNSATGTQGQTQTQTRTGS